MSAMLPQEIIEHILSTKNVSISDVLHFLRTNRYNYEVFNNSRIWREKYFQISSQFSEILERNTFNYDWYGEVQYIYNLKQTILENLSLMSSRLYKRRRYEMFSDSDFIEFLKLYQEEPRTYYYLVHNLMSIVNAHIPINNIDVVPMTTPGNKTLQYYAMKTLMYLRKLYLTKERDLLTHEQKTLEKWAAFIVQWCRPYVDVSWKKLAMELDKIAEQVKDHLKMAYPHHPLFAVSKETLHMWRNANIKGNQYGDMHCKQISDVLEDFFSRPEFPNNAIKEFLETVKYQHGINIILLIIRESVARRLGLKYELVKSLWGDTFSLQLSKIYKVEEKDTFGTDMSAHGYRNLFHVQESLQKDILDSLAVYTQEAYHGCALYWNVCQFTDTRLRIHSELLLLRYECCCQYTNGPFSETEIKAKDRPPNLKYAVGMVMKHRRIFDYSEYRHYHTSIQPCVCVICDWDPVRLSRYDKPVYNVLFPNGWYEDIPEDELEPVPNKTDRLLSLAELGRHFSHVFETHFVPNIEKEREYPADTAVRHAYHQMMKDDENLVNC